jgi:hypothetical protein
VDFSETGHPPFAQGFSHAVDTWNSFDLGEVSHSVLVKFETIFLLAGEFICVHPMITSSKESGRANLFPED